MKAFLYTTLFILFSTTFVNADVFSLADGITIDTSKAVKKIATGSECGLSFPKDKKCELTCFEGVNKGPSTYTCDVVTTALYYEKWSIGNIDISPMPTSNQRTYYTGNSIPTFDSSSKTFHPYEKVKFCFNLEKPLNTQDSKWILANNYPQVQATCIEKESKKYCDGDVWPLPKQCCDGSLPEISPLCGISCNGSQTPTPSECCDGTIPIDFPICNPPTCDGSEWPLPKECCDNSFPPNSPLCEISCDGSEDPTPPQCCDGTITPKPPICEPTEPPPICDGSEWPLPEKCCDGTLPENAPLCGVACDETQTPIPGVCCDGTIPQNFPVCDIKCDGSEWPLPTQCCNGTFPENSPFCSTTCEGDSSSPIGLPLPSSCCNGDIPQDFPLCDLSCDGSEWPLPSECCNGTIAPRPPLCNAPVCDGSEWPLAPECCDGSLPENSPYCGITCEGDSSNPLPQFPLPDSCCNGDINEDFPLCELNCEDSGNPIPSECCDGTLPETPPICMPPAPICDGSVWPLPDGCCGNTNPEDNSPYCDIRCEGDSSNPLPGLPLPDSCCNGDINFNFPLCGITCDGTEDPEPFVCCDGTLDPLPDFCNLTPIGSDPLYPDAWHLENTGQKNYARQGGTEGFDVKAKPVIERGIRGDGVKVAISDTGIEVTHEDLWQNYDPEGSKNFFLSSPYDGNPIPGGTTSTDSHGTSVTGIIAAVGGNNIGARGVAPNAKLGGFNYLAVGVPGFGMTLTQIDGPFDIFNYSYGMFQCQYNSFGGSTQRRMITEAYEDGVTNLRGGKGAIYVKSAGNFYNIFYGNCGFMPSWTPSQVLGNANFEEGNNYIYTIIAGAMEANGGRASYSSPGTNLWVSAPGGEDGNSRPAIMATDLSGCNAGRARSSSSSSFENGSNPKNSECNYTSRMNGTSSAAPNTSGVIALILSANPDLTWRDVKHILASNSRLIVFGRGIYGHPQGREMPQGHIYAEKWVENAAGYNFHYFYGFGLVNAAAAVDAALTYKTDLGELQETTYDSGSLSKNVPNFNASGATDSINIIADRVVEAVQINVTLTHQYIDNIGLELYSPSGTKSIIMNVNSGIIDANLKNNVYLTNAFYGENAKGNWTLKVIDGSDLNPDGTKGSSGILTNWKLTISGHNPTSSSLASHQKIPADILFSKNEDFKKLPPPQINKSVMANTSDRYQTPFDPYLVRKTKDFFWSPKIFAVLKKDFRGRSDQIIGNLAGLKVITALLKPFRAYYVVKNRSNKRVGIYTEKIVIFGGKDRDIRKALRRRGLSYTKIKGVYVVKKQSFPGAYQIRNGLRRELKDSKVFLDIRYQQIVPL